MYHQRHHLQSSGWMAHQHVTGYIFTGYEPKSSGLGGGAVQLLLTYLSDLFFVLVIYTLCGALSLQSFKLQRSLGDTGV